jgi:hypothetical protein
MSLCLFSVMNQLTDLREVVFEHRVTRGQPPYLLLTLLSY